MLTLRPALVLSTVAFGLLVGCGGAEVTEASCNACAGASYSAEQCHEWGEAAGCESSSFVPGSGSGCRNGCSFQNCDSPPMCESRTPEPERDAMVPMVDPRCERSSDGLFTSDPPCDEPSEFNLNGVRYYYCKCSSAGCPCGYECGSIPLRVGGTIGSACAPPD